MTCAIEGGVFFWDIRPEKSPLAIDKTRDQLTVPKDVPLTFAALDAKWKPILRVSLFRPENGPEHCARRFCMRERQGDRSILESRANVKKKMAAEKDPTKIGLAKLPPLEGINSHLYVGTEDGDIVYVDWMPQKDTQTAKMQTTMPVFFATQHDGPISYLNRSPFLPEVLLCVGGWTWSLWKEGVNTGPLISSCACSKAYTGGCWSPTRPSVFFVIRADGTLESWDLLDKTHEPALMQNVSASALTSISIKVEGKKQLMAVGDMHGALRVLIVPHRMKVCGATELDAMNTYIDREVRRRDFVLARWNKREQERIEKENENKRMAGIATVGKLTDEEILKKWRAEYEVYLAGEREFLRALGLFHEEEEDQPAAAQPEAAPA
nr:unnamed protein product [Spirometra erinaceieuropaei]